jgi:hypothetical protein
MALRVTRENPDRVRGWIKEEFDRVDIQICIHVELK